jgi:hypothetical protein
VERAARFIENMQTFDEEDGADPRFREILAWAYDHGQSLDWLFDGDLVGLICRPASTSPIATAIPDPAFAAIERFRAARKASEAVGKESHEMAPTPHTIKNGSTDRWRWSTSRARRTRRW